MGPHSRPVQHGSNGESFVISLSLETLVRNEL